MSGLNRLKFSISTDTGGDFTETSGPCAGGLIMQMRFSRTPVGDTGLLDTGADLKLEAVNAAGTALFTIAHFTNAGGSSWTRVPRVLTYDTGGAQIGDQYPVVTPADRLKLTVTQSGGVAGNKTGTFYVWTGW
jgi:hypothetical protein